MPSALDDLPTAALHRLSAALRSGQLGMPVAAAALAKLGLHGLPNWVAAELTRALEAAGGPCGVAWGLERVVAARESAARCRPELVWTGPEMPGASSRDTAVLVRGLFQGARRSVLVSTYAVYQGAQVFEPLAERMREVPSLSVRIFLNVERPHGTPPNVTDAKLLRDFAEDFVSKAWPASAPLPQLFYDPRALSTTPGPRACLHAKCIVVDDERAFVTSANFTEAAHERNIETGVLVHDPAFACTLRDQFETLVTTGQLRRLPVLPS